MIRDYFYQEFILRSYKVIKLKLSNYIFNVISVINIRITNKNVHDADLLLYLIIFTMKLCIFTNIGNLK